MGLSTIIFLVYKWVLQTYPIRAAIKKLVFEEGRLTPQSYGMLWKPITRANVEKKSRDAYPWCTEVMERWWLCNSLVREAYDIYVDEIAKYQILAMDVGQSVVSVTRVHLLFLSHVGQGRGTCYSGRCRNAGTPLAGCSPSHNMDQHGPTSSVLKSVSKLPTDEIVGGVFTEPKSKTHKL